ncbi:MAG: hypothetical protein ACHQUC_08495, partial [Chlamydiales bacterium]
MLGPLSSQNHSLYNSQVFEETFYYRRLDRNDLTPEQAWEILSREPIDAERKQNLIENAANYVIRFHLERLPDWMGFSEEDLRSIYLFSHPEALWNVWMESGKQLDPQLISDFNSEKCRDENGAHVFHYLCSWNDSRKFDLIFYISSRTTSMSRLFFFTKDQNDQLPLDLLTDPTEQKQFIERALNHTQGRPSSNVLAQLVGLQDLTLAKLWVEQRADALLNIAFPSIESMHIDGRVVVNKPTSPLSALEKRNVDPKEFEFFFEQWDQQMAGRFSFNSTFFRALYLPWSPATKEDEF